MSTREKIENRLDTLKLQLENGEHLINSEAVEDTIYSISKFWVILEEDQKDFVNSARDAVEDKLEWR